MVIRRGDLCWAELGAPTGHRPAKRRPVLVIQADPYNDSGLKTVLVAAVTSNTALAMMPGNVFLPASVCKLARDSVVNVTALVTLDKADLGRPVARVPFAIMRDVDDGLRQILRL